MFFKTGEFTAKIFHACTLHKPPKTQFNVIVTSSAIDKIFGPIFEQNATINFESIFEQNANFGPIFEKSAYFGPIFEKSVNFEHFVNGK